MKEGIDYSKVHPGIMQLVIAEDRALGRGTYKSAGFYSEKPSEKDGPPGSELRAHFFLGSRNGTYADEDILTAMGEHTAAIIEQVATGVLRPPQNTYHQEKVLGLFMRNPHQKMRGTELVTYHVISNCAPEGFYSLPKSERNRILSQLGVIIDESIRAREEKKREKRQ